MRNIVIGVFIVLASITLISFVNKSLKKHAVKSMAIKIMPTTTPKPATTSTPSATIAEMLSPTPQETQQAIAAIIKTAKGDIILKLFPDVAPKTVANFVKKAKDGYYNNLTFHRVEDWVIQGGDPLGTGTGGGSMPSELNNKPFIIGAIGVARTPIDKQISNDSQFFITKRDSQFLNGDYTNFGIVTNGMDVVNKIAVEIRLLE